VILLTFGLVCRIASVKLTNAPDGFYRLRCGWKHVGEGIVEVLQPRLSILIEEVVSRYVHTRVVVSDR
jgi:hypothetical protein